MISVAIAAYNGEKYLPAQLDSILPQLGEGDEIIVSDDAPGGETQRLVSDYEKKDKRVRYFEGPGKGLIKNFEHALGLCRGDIIFLCDQDDVWLPDKAAVVKSALEGGATLVLHDAYETDGELNIINSSFFSARSSRSGFLRNIIKNSYMGCCMAFERRLLDFALPFPDGLPMHDQWLGLTAEKCGHVELIREPLIYHRLHGGNMTGGSTPVSSKLKWRFRLIKCLIKRKKG